jgi:hypothetical protein
MRGMKPFVSDELWAVVESLLPKERKAGKKRGRPRESNARC